MNYSIVGLIIDIVIILALTYGLLKAFKYRNTKKSPFAIITIISLILLIPIIKSISSNVSELVHPTPFLRINTKDIRIKGTNTTGTLNGRTSSNAKIILKDVDGISDTIYTKSNNNGNFKAKKLDPNTKYKLFATKYGKKSPVKKISVSDIPETAYTKFQMNHTTSNDLFLKASNNSLVTVSGTSSPHAKIKIEDSDNDYKIVKKIESDKNGKWTTKIQGPNNKKEQDYYISAKINDRLTNDGNSIYIENTDYKKKAIAKSTKYQKYIKQLNHYVYRGNATDVYYNQSDNIVTWTGFDAWEDYSHEDLEPLITILQAVTLRRADANDVKRPNIIINLPNGQQIAHREVGNEMVFDN